MASDIQPAELALLIDYAERPRVDDWSLRAALTRYAQPQPQRVGDLLEAVRRIEFAMASHRRTIDETGPELWRVVQEADGGSTSDPLLGMLLALVELDGLADMLAAWAADPTRERPDDAVETVTADVTRRLDELGIPREERQPPSRRRA